MSYACHAGRRGFESGRSRFGDPAEQRSARRPLSFRADVPLTPVEHIDAFEGAVEETALADGGASQPPTGVVAWISYTPVKGLRLHNLETAWLATEGIPGDRAFFLVDERREKISATRLGSLLEVRADHDPKAGSLELRFPDRSCVSGPVELGEPELVTFSGDTLTARPVLGPFSAALSRHAGVELHLVASPPERPGLDRGARGAVTLLSLASLERLRQVAGGGEAVDERRFRMTIGVEGIDPHGEDAWIGQTVRIGGALARIGGHVGRCAATTRAPDSGVVDFPALRHLASYRSTVRSEEPLPFGVFGAVCRPGAVSVGDPVGPVPQSAVGSGEQ